MPNYKRIYNWADLPDKAPKEMAEPLTLDFKGPHKKDSAEMAKDMAAFANLHGGVILVGVAETADNYARTLLSATEAERVKKDYEDAARDLLAPRPLVDPVVVTFTNEPEKALVAVNVDPFPGQLIGAKEPGTEGWRFPIRTATRHTTYLDPEKAMIYADPKTRKAAILLGALSAGEHIWVHVRFDQQYGQLNSSGPERFAATWNGVNEQTNTMDLRLEDGGIGPIRVHAPLENARAVWVDEGRWAISLKGAVQLVKAGMNVDAVVVYSPG